eukprot:Gb_08663 [translate_table: standard]
MRKQGTSENLADCRASRQKWSIFVAQQEAAKEGEAFYFTGTSSGISFSNNSSSRCCHLGNNQGVLVLRPHFPLLLLILVDQEITDREMWLLSTLDTRRKWREKETEDEKRMREQPEEFLEELKTKLRVILEGSGGVQHREEFAFLQKLVQSRTDLTPESMVRAHRTQLALCCCKNRDSSLFASRYQCHTVLFEIFAHKRCRNIACQNQLPADDCNCEICSTKSGFCNLFTCAICSKFNFDVNTCQWVGCDMCSHWTHTDCDIRIAQISMGPSLMSGAGSSEMPFRCRACKRTSDLLGWVRDVFQHCAPGTETHAIWNLDSGYNEIWSKGSVASSNLCNV